MKTFVARASALHPTGVHSVVRSGPGDDTYHVPGDVVSESPDGGIDLVIATVTYTLGDNVENLTLDGTDNIDGTGNGLNNVITGNSGNNILTGGDGNDTLDGRGGGDNYWGGAGDDTYYYVNGEDTINESPGDGTDTILIDGSINVAGSNVENVGLLGTGNHIAFGDDGVNMLTGNSGDNTLNGNGGDDHLIGGEGTDILDGGAGNDTLEDASGPGEMHGGDGDDLLFYNSIDYGLLFDGGDGVDTIDLSPFDAGGTVVNLAQGTYFDGGSSTPSTLMSIENVIGGGLSDTFTGSNADNVLKGNAGEDSFYAGDGNDTVYGGDDNDVIYGGNGINTLYGEGGDDYIQTQTTFYGSTYDGGDGRDTIDYSWMFGDYSVVIDLTAGTYRDNAAGEETVLNFENVLGTQGSEMIIGNDAVNSLYGYDGNDLLNGMAGADTLRGGKGDDTFVVDNAGDTVTELNKQGTDTVMSSVTFTVGGQYIENVILTGTANIGANGNGIANSLTGNSGNNLLNGNRGADSMAGGDGNDTYYVDVADDVVTEAVNQGKDVVYSSITYALGANVENLILTGFQKLDGAGNGLDNQLTGNANANVLNGGDGKDVLIGQAGNDTLTGGNGADQFRFAHAGIANGVDHITDFQTGVDKLVLLAADYGIARGHVLTAAEFHGGGAVGAGTQFLYNTINHALYWDSDGAGGTAPIAIAVFDNAAALKASDFVFL